MTSFLGDLFPQSFKDKYTDQKITPGSVFRLFSQDTNPPKIKRFVVLGFDTTAIFVGILYINSEINENIFPSKDLQNLHLSLKAANCPYLDHDSYLDCSQIYEISFAKLKNEFMNSSEIYYGNLSEIDLDNAKNLARSAKTISIKDKRKYQLIP